MVITMIGIDLIFLIDLKKKTKEKLIDIHSFIPSTGI